MPSTNGHGNARAVAKLMGALARHQLLSAETMARATQEQSATGSDSACWDEPASPVCDEDK